MSSIETGKNATMRNSIGICPKREAADAIASAVHRTSFFVLILLTAAGRPEVSGAAPSQIPDSGAPAGAARAFARTAEAGHFTTDAVRESGEHGGGLTPTSEDAARFTREGNEAFGACMTLWNAHRWAEAREAMLRFSAERPDDPWRGESDLHVACYHKFRGEYTEAEKILADLYAENTGNPVGRKALVRLSHLYFETFRYQAAYEALHQLLAMDPVESEKTFALNWIPHVYQSWLGAANARDCGPKAFGFAAWLADNGDAVAGFRAAEAFRTGGLCGACVPPVSFGEVSGAFPWAVQKGETNGVTLAGMRGLLARNGWRMETRLVSYDEAAAAVSEDRPAVLCLPAPDAPLFAAASGVSARVRAARAGDRRLAGASGAADLGHYMVLAKATDRNAWLYDPENGMLQKDALMLKDLWLRGRDRGLAVFLSRKTGSASHTSSGRLPGVAVGAEAEAAFSGGCCGHSVNNNDTGVSNDSTPWGDKPEKSTCGMPEHQVNTLNMNYLIADTPIWVKVPGGDDLDLTLTYNNRDSYYAKYMVTNVQNAPFGYRWSAPYDGNYALDPASNILVRFPSGMDVYFDRQSGGGYLPRDYRYSATMGLTVLPDKRVRVDVEHGEARYWFHSLTNLALQQTLYRVENRFGAGTDIARDAGGRIVKVSADATGASLNYLYDGNGNVTDVFEKDGAGVATGRRALFSYGVANGVSRLASMTDMGGYTTAFEYGVQTYDTLSIATDGAAQTTNTVESAVSGHHVTAYTWPNGGRWAFDLRQTFWPSTVYSQPLRLTITDPVGKDTVYNAYTFSEYSTGPVGERDRDGASWFWGLDTVDGSAAGTYTTLVNDRRGGDYTRKGEYVDYRQYSASGRRDLLFSRAMTEPVTGEVGLGLDRLRAGSDTANAPRREASYAYITVTNTGHRVVTVTNSVYRRVSGTVQRTDLWAETVEQDANEDIVRTVDRAGNAVFLDRNTNRLVTAVRIQPAGEPAKTVWQASYNRWGLMTTQTVDEALQAVVSYEYDAARRLSRVRHPDGTSETFSYTPSTHFLAAYTNRVGQGVRFTRDAMGRPVRTDFADGTFATSHYGCCAADAVTDRRGVTARFGFDPDKRLETAVVPMNAAAETCVKYGYTGEGALSSLGYGPSFTNLATRTFGFMVTNGASRLASRTTPRGKTTDAWTHTFTGLPATHTDGRGVLTTNVWDAAKGLLLQSTVLGAARGFRDVADACAYDALDRLTNAVRTVAGSETWRETYAYDSRSRPFRTDTRVQNIPGQGPALAYSVSYAYDARGLVTNRTLTVGAAAVPTSYGYDPACPRLVSVSDPYARAAYSYDACGRLSSKQLLTPNSSLLTSTYSSYDSLSRLSSLAVSNQTALLWGASYTYDIDRLASVTVTAGGDARATAYAYDLQGQLTGAIGHTPSNTLDTVERFAYDAVGNMTARSLSAPPPPTGAEGAAALTPNADDEAVLYRRHAMATLVGTVESNATLSLPLAPGVAVEQDALGNWVAPFVPVHPASNGQVRVQLKAEKAGQNPDYRLASFNVNQSSTALRYDGNGALLNLPTGLQLTYDAEGNLETVSSNGTAVTENWYDAAGRRIAKREGGALTLYLWDGMEILATANADGTLREYFSRGSGIAGDVGSLLAEHSFATGQTVFLHGNHRGDVVLATDFAGAVVSRYEYSAFGMPLSATGSYVPRFGFSSKERDASGLVYFGFRFHSPELCRWVGCDPTREKGGLNLFAFAWNNPIGYVDPNGKYSVLIGSAVVVFGVGYIIYGIVSEYLKHKNDDDPVSATEAAVRGSGALLSFLLSSSPPVAKPEATTCDLVTDLATDIGTGEAKGAGSDGIIDKIYTDRLLRKFPRGKASEDDETKVRPLVP